jgi:pSer/pThr/pTyr-binding forkhead associated (FHA) protein
LIQASYLDTVEEQEAKMPKVSVMIDGVVINEVELVKERTSIGRRPYNDIVIENLAVSGEHAALMFLDGRVVVEDLNSTNGTYINGKAVKKQLLAHGDTLEIGKYKVRFDAGGQEDFEKTMVFKPQAVAPATPSLAKPKLAPSEPMPELHGAIKVISGAAVGREMPLTKVVTTVGKPGVAVAAITRRQHHFLVHHVEGLEQPLLNGVPVGAEPVVLQNGDLIVLAGTQMQFQQT